MSLYSVELTVPADNSWVLQMQERIRDLRAMTSSSELPTVQAIGGSGSGTLVLLDRS